MLVPACPPGAQASATNVLQALRAAVHGRGKPGGAAAQHDEVEPLTVDLGAKPERARDLGRRRVAHHVRGVDEDGCLGARDVEPPEHLRALLVGVDVVEPHRQQVALEQVADLERAAGLAPGDDPHHAVALALVPGTPDEQCAEDVLAELGPARDHLPQRGPVELDHVRLLDGDARADRRLARERRDVADERAAVGLGDMDFLAGLAVDELDQPALDHEERRVAHGVLVEHLAGLERPPLAALPEPRELRIGQPRKELLVVERRVARAPKDLDRRHLNEATS